MVEAYRKSTDLKLSTTNGLAALVNLVYLIRMRSHNPADVIQYADIADDLLRELSTTIQSLPAD